MKPERASQSREKTDEEKKYKYPVSVFFILGNEFCERFSYSGMRTVLALYLTASLSYSEDTSTVIYHVFVMISYFTPLLGGIISDAWLEKFRTILYLSFVYALGNVVLAFGSIHTINLPHRALTLVGLGLIAVGTGGIKPCVSAFGGDQFLIPQQQRELERFFSIFYLFINVGSLFSTFISPILRDAHCLGSHTDCYPLAFGLPALLMIVSLVIFLIGTPLYKMKKPEGNIAFDVTGCIRHALAQKISATHRREHWLDYADDKYNTALIDDVKMLMKLLCMFAPTVVFWALFEQQGSRWIFQANRMNGDLGWYVVQPDQMQTLNPVICLIFIPIFDTLVYPILSKLHILTTPLQKLSVGGLLAALSFVVSGILQLWIQSDNPLLPGVGEAELRLYNGLDCEGHVSSPTSADIPPLGTVGAVGISPLHALDLKINTTCGSYRGNLTLRDQQISSYLLSQETNGSLYLYLLNPNETSEIIRGGSNSPKLNIIYSGLDELMISLKKSNASTEVKIEGGAHESGLRDISSGKYTVSVNGQSFDEEIVIDQGGVYSVLLGTSVGKMKVQQFTLVQPNSISIFWQIPQYFLISIADIMFTITGLEFSYSQSPVSMKSLISSLWLMTNSFGNIIVLVVAGFQMSNQAYEMFLFAGLMAFFMGIFIYLSLDYKYVVYEQGQGELEDEKSL